MNELRPKKERKGFISLLLRSNDEKTEFDAPTIRNLLGALASWGGKNKDEIVQALCHEIGVATAAILKEPLNQVIQNRKLQITFELVPKAEEPAVRPAKKKKSA